MDCEICCNKFNKTLRKSITCLNCKKSVCKKCIISWCSEKTNIICCLCNSIFSYNFCINNLGKSFMTKYSKIQKDILFSKELEFIKDSQIFIEIEKISEDTWKKYTSYSKFYNKVKTIKSSNLQNNKDVMNYISAMDNNSKVTKTRLMADIRFNRENYLELYRSYRNAFIHGNLDYIRQVDENIVKKHKENKTVCPCPNDNCKGFVKSITYDCGICNLKICSKCFHILTDKEHICNKEDIETIKFVIKDTKPCPTCGTRISKIDGCDQMFCIECNTAFSWRTGLVEKGRIHNPHYYEKLRNQGLVIPREPGDQPGENQQCNEPEILPYHLQSHICYNQYHNILEKYIHNQYILNQYKLNINDDEFKINYTERIMFMKNKIDEYKFKMLIYKKLKHNQFRFELINEIDGYNNASKTLIFELHDIIISNDRLSFSNKKIINSINKLIDLFSMISDDLKEKLKIIYDTYSYKFKNEIKYYKYCYINKHNIIEIL